MWNRNFSRLIAADVLLLAGVYMLFPLFYRWLIHAWGCTLLQSGGLMLTFIPALFIPGAFSSYLVDTFVRKHVYTRSVVLMIVAGLLIPHVPEFWMVGALWMLTGILFSIALMVSGSTLVIDISPSNKRNAANRVFTWASLIGTLLGLSVGVGSMVYFDLRHCLYLSIALCALSVVLVCMVSVCFRAPLNLPLCSFDRFILKRTLLPGLNMMAVPLVWGIVLASLPDLRFYLSVSGGFFIYLLVREICKAPMNGRLQVLIGQLLTLGGLCVLFTAETDARLWVGGCLVGLGTGFSIGRFLQMMILLPLHCERGTGYQTFQLLWQTALMTGLFATSANLLAVSFAQGCELAAGVCLVGLLCYQLFTHRYFDKHYLPH